MRKALVIGLNDYPGCPLDGCVNDANAVASILARNGDNTPNFDVQKITNNIHPIFLVSDIDSAISLTRKIG